MAAPQRASAAKATAPAEKVTPPEPAPIVAPSPTILCRVVGEGHLKYGGVLYDSGAEVEIERSIAEGLIDRGSVEEVG